MRTRNVAGDQTGAARPNPDEAVVPSDSGWNLGGSSLTFFLCLAAGIALFLHVPSFYRERKEGDEVVYLELARAMNWDLSHYTTMDSPSIRQFPYSIYRQPLFHHGPLYPLILKVGQLGNAPVEAGLLFANVCLLGLLLCLLATRRLLPSDGLAMAVGLLFVALEPLLLFTTTRLLHDGLSGILLAVGLLAYVTALDSRRTGLAVGAGLLLSAALNMRYNCLVALPLLPLLQLYSLFRQSHPVNSQAETSPNVWQSVLRNPAHWKIFAIVTTIVMTVGMQHFYRLLAHYGTLDPGVFIVPDANIDEVLPVAAFWKTQTRLQSTFHLFLMMPIAFLPFAPPVVVAAIRGFRNGAWTSILWAAFVYLFGCWIWLSHTQLRYAAVWTPLLCLLLPWTLTITARRFPKLLLSMLAFTVVSAVSSDFMSTVIDESTGEIVPAIYFYLPFLSPLYRTGWGA